MADHEPLYRPHGFTLSFENNLFDELDALNIEIRKLHLRTRNGMVKLTRW